MAKTKTKSKVKKIKKTVPHGIAHILTSYNNTIITISDLSGNVLCWSSAGAIGYKGSKKSTSYAAQMVASQVSKKAISTFSMKTISVKVKGNGPGKTSAIRGLHNNGLFIDLIKDITPVPFNGCRPPKKPRN